MWHDTILSVAKAVSRVVSVQVGVVSVRGHNSGESPVALAHFAFRFHSTCRVRRDTGGGRLVSRGNRRDFEVFVAVNCDCGVIDRAFLAVLVLVVNLSRLLSRRGSSIGLLKLKLLKLKMFLLLTQKRSLHGHAVDT